jgi:hypothetical protein
MPAPVRVDARYQNALAVNLGDPVEAQENNLLALENTQAPRSQESDARHGFRY